MEFDYNFISLYFSVRLKYLICFVCIWFKSAVENWIISNNFRQSSVFIFTSIPLVPQLMTVLPPGHLAISGDIFACTDGEWGGTSIEWLEARVLPNISHFYFIKCLQ